jgi:hypothetical protein
MKQIPAFCKINNAMLSEKLAIIIKPLATPFSTSMELIVLPVIGIMKIINPK